jgi:hypothetical protein
MNTRTVRIFFAAILAVVISTGAASSAYGQTTQNDPQSTTAPVFPHDFSNDFYKLNGIVATSIRFRLTGKDSLSVIEATNHPSYSDVRALITLGAYTGDRGQVYWNPFGVVSFSSSDRAKQAYALSLRHPIYVFPAPAPDIKVSPFSYMRQAVIIDDTSAGYAAERNPLSLRAIARVKFLKPTSEKAAAVLKEMASINGTAGDGLPVVKGIGDLSTLKTYDLIEISTASGEVAIAPIITNEKAFAKDAFLSTVLYKEKPLEAEVTFVTKFECLTKGFCS